jgi:uncharacterized membrane protein
MKPKDLPMVYALFALVASLCVLFDVQVARQIVGFLYLTFLPGSVIVGLLKMDGTDFSEKIVLSAGLSVAFVMIIGLFISESYSLLGFSRPLSLIPLIVILDSFVLGGAFFLHRANAEDGMTMSISFKPKAIILGILISLLPITSTIGAITVGVSGNSSLLLLVIAITALLFSSMIIRSKGIWLKLYLPTVFLISITLLFHSSLISSFIQGHDTHLEYYTAETTRLQATWFPSSSFSQLDVGRFNSMLSVTVLPAIYSSFLDLETAWVLKIVYPLVFSLVPISLYTIWRKHTSNKIAFVSAILLMGEITFHSEMLALGRQMIAELFFVLLLSLILSKRTHSANGKLCFVILGFGLIVSHYSIAIIFWVLAFLLWLRGFWLRREPVVLGLPLVALFSTMIFSWYVYTSQSASFDAIMLFGERVYLGFGDFLDLTSRGSAVMRGVGLEAAQSSLQTVSRLFAYAVQFFIIAGFVVVLLRRGGRQINKEYLFVSSMNLGLLIACILIPNLAGTLGMERFFHLTLFCLAPFFALGCDYFLSLFKGKRGANPWILVLLILLPYFLFQTGFIYEITGNKSWSVPLSKYRMGSLELAVGGHVKGADVAGALWLSRNVVSDFARVYSDIPSQSYSLTSYGLFPREQIEVLTNVTTSLQGGFIFLSRLNVNDEIVVAQYPFALAEIPASLGNLTGLYTNGFCEVYLIEEEIGS